MKHRRPRVAGRRWRTLNVPLELYRVLAERAASTDLSISHYHERILRNALATLAPK